VGPCGSPRPDGHSRDRETEQVTVRLPGRYARRSNRRLYWGSGSGRSERSSVRTRGLSLRYVRIGNVVGRRPSSGSRVRRGIAGGGLLSRQLLITIATSFVCLSPTAALRSAVESVSPVGRFAGNGPVLGAPSSVTVDVGARFDVDPSAGEVDPSVDDGERKARCRRTTAVGCCDGNRVRIDQLRVRTASRRTRKSALSVGVKKSMRSNPGRGRGIVEASVTRRSTRSETRRTVEVATRH